MVDHLRHHRGLVDRQARAGHEVVRGALAQLGEKGEHLVADETHQRFAREALGPDRPAEALARDRGRGAQGGGAGPARILHGQAGRGRLRIQRVLQLPLAIEEAGVRLLEEARTGAVLGVDALDQIEEEQE
jgi:hypothetical protein